MIAVQGSEPYIEWGDAAQAGRHAEAYSALGEAVRLKRDSWQTWANFARAAARAGHPLQAARGAIQARAVRACCVACQLASRRAPPASAATR